MSGVIDEIGKRISKFSDQTPAAQRANKVSLVYEIINLLDTKDVPDNALKEIKKLCNAMIDNTSVARDVFNQVHVDKTGQLYHKHTVPTKFINPGVEKWVRKLSSAESAIYDFALDSTSLSQDSRLAVMLCNAAVEGGLCFSAGLNALLKLVMERDIFTEAGAERLIRLKYSAPNHPVNIKTREERYTNRAFYPPPLTTSCIYGFLRNGTPKSKNSANATTRIRIFLASLLNDESIEKISDKALLESLSLIFFRKKGMQAPAFLLAYARGQLNSVSTFDECLLAQYSYRYPKALKGKQTRVVKRASARRSSNKRFLQSGCDTIIQDIRAMLNAHDKANSSAERIHDDLVIFLESLEVIPESIRAFISWFIHMFSIRKWKVADSGRRKLSSLGTVWFAVAEGINLEEHDSRDNSLLHTQLLESEGNADSAFVGNLMQFWNYLHEHWDCELPEQFERYGRGVKFVRATIPGALQVRQLFADIGKAYEDSSAHVVESVTLALILMARCGLRPSESLHLEVKDIDLRNDGLLCIRRNAHSSPKTFSGTRKLAFGVFLMPDEAALFRAFFRQRQVETSGRKNALLFSEYEFNDSFINYDRLSAEASRLLSSYLGRSVNLYQLRHFALTNWQLICFATKERALQVTKLAPEQIEAIRDYFNGASHDNTLFEIASAAGHLESKISMTTYLHCTDILLYEAALRAENRCDYRVLASLASVQHGRVKRIISTNGMSDLLNNSDMVAVLDELFNTERANFVKKLKEKPGSTSYRFPNFRLATQRKAEQVDKILHAHDDKFSTQEIADVFNLPKHWIERVIKAAQYYRHDEQYQTDYGNPRLYPKASIENPATHLSLVMPKENNEKLESLEILQSLQRLSKSDSNRVRKSADLFLQNVTFNRRSITLKSKRDLQRIMKALGHLVAPERWLLKLHINKETNRDSPQCQNYWYEYLPDEATFTVVKDSYEKDRKFGRVELSYMNAELTSEMKSWMKEKGIKYRSSRALICALHHYAIYLRAEADYLNSDYQPSK